MQTHKRAGHGQPAHNPLNTNQSQTSTTVPPVRLQTIIPDAHTPSMPQMGVEGQPRRKIVPQQQMG
jgi:hypothetical protein